MKRLLVILIAVTISGPVQASFEQRPGEPPPRSPTYPTPAPQASNTAVEQLVKDYEIAFNNRDAKALAALYSAEAVRMEDGRVLRGRAAIQQFYVQSVGSSKTPRLTVRPGRSQMIRDDVALLDGSYELADGTGGVYVITAVQESGQWRLAAVVPVPDR
jgi:uncharacterized protein (TIGR02246 family)